MQNEDKTPFLWVVAVVGVVCVIAWLCHDLARNKPVYTDTNATMERIENRIQSVEQRIDSMSARLTETEKTITDIGGRINTSTNLAKEIGTGIGSAENRLDDAIQRSGRIANIIADIERKNK